MRLDHSTPIKLIFRKEQKVYAPGVTVGGEILQEHTVVAVHDETIETVHDKNRFVFRRGQMLEIYTKRSQYYDELIEQHKARLVLCEQDIERHRQAIMQFMIFKETCDL